MKKKYIIELESGTHIFVLGPEGIVHIGEPDVVYETVDGMQIGDAVINAKPYAEPDLEQVRKEAYAEGFKDGQYAARNGLVANYAQVQETIQVGDEVVFGNDEEIKAVVIDEADEAGVWLLLSENGCVERMDGVLFHRTGRHFPEFAAVLKKMRGEQDG